LHFFINIFVKDYILFDRENEGSDGGTLDSKLVSGQSNQEHGEQLVVGVESYPHDHADVREDSLGDASNLVVCVGHGGYKLNDVVFEKHLHILQVDVGLVLRGEVLQLLDVSLNEPQPLLGWLTLDERGELFVNIDQVLDTVVELVLLDNERKKLVSFVLGFIIVDEDFDSLHQDHLVFFLQLHLVHHSDQHIQRSKRLVQF